MSTPVIPAQPFRGLMPRGTEKGGADMRAAFDVVSAAHPVDEQLKRVFLGNRRRLARTHVLAGLAERQRAMQTMDALGPEAAAAEHDAPVPGGVGYGMFYQPPFKESFASGTAIYWEIVCPATAGGNVSSFLYLTATNRSALGVEALISFFGQSVPQFLVYDWARKRENSDPWAHNLPIESLAQYLHSATAHGAAFSVLPLRNATFEIGANVWVNQVSLLNAGTNAWDLVYQFQYNALPTDQHNAWPGSWGPIVETFEPRYQGTNPMGALNTQLAFVSNGTWGPWTPLGPSSAQLRADNRGMLPLFLDPNASWVVAS